jgi:hypothetical protein
MKSWRQRFALIAHGSALFEYSDVIYRLERDGARPVSKPEAA